MFAEIAVHGVSLFIWSVGLLVVGIAIGYAIRHFVVNLRGGSLSFDREGSAPTVPPSPLRRTGGTTGTNPNESDPDPLT